MGWADRVAESDPTKGGVYFKDGVYPLLYIEKVHLKQSRKGKDLYIVELKILSSNVEDRPEGSEVSQVYNLSDHDAAPGNVKAFIGAAMGDEAFANADIEKMTLEERKEFIAAIEETTSASNPLHGRLVRAEARTIETKAKTPFTLVTFGIIPEEVQAKAQELHNAAFAPF